MLALERRNLIYEKLQIEKKVVVGELSQLFHVSEETIRRDLDRLEKEGLVIKSYGGAVINDNTSIDLPFNIRKKHNVPGKQKIADLIVDFVKDGEHIMLDPSSTAVFIAKALKKKDQLTVVTNSIEVMLELSDMKDWNIISPGGDLKDGMLALVGPKTIEGIGAYCVEKTIISCKAFDIEKGFSDSSEDFAYAKQKMLHSARERILAVDSSKFGKSAFCKVGDLKDIDIIVTDKKPDIDTLEKLEDAKVKCIYPEDCGTEERSRLYAEALFGN